jgi:ABC-type sugar transport system permease subunit
MVRRKSGSLRKSIRREPVIGFILILPVIILVFFLIFYPLTTSFIMSFTDKQLGVFNPRNVGLSNYAELIKSKDFLNALSRSFFWTVVSVAFQLSIGLSLALLLNRGFRLRFFFRGLFIVPWVTSPIVIAILWRWLLNGMYGIVNQLLMDLAVISKPLGWFGSHSLVMPTVIFINIWRGVPFMMIVFLGGLQTIPLEIKDALRVDGTPRIMEFIYITLPFLKKIIIISTLIFVLWNFNNFDLIYLLTRGGPGKYTFTLPIYVYSQAFEAFKYGNASALSGLMFLVLVIISLIYLRMMYREE